MPVPTSPPRADAAEEPRPLSEGNGRSEPAGEELRTSPGVRVRWLFTCASLTVSRWSCCTEQHAASGEKHQPWHVIGFVHGGSFLLHSAAGRAVVDPNCLLFFNPLQPYSTSHPFGCGDRGSSLVLSPELLRDLLEPLAPAAADRDEPFFPSQHAVSGPDLHLGQLRLVERLTRPALGPADPLAVEEEALELAAAAVASLCGSARPGRSAAKQATERFHRERVEAARELMQRRYKEPLQLEQIAKAVHMSACHLARVFRRQTGVPVHRYLMHLRLRAALEAASEGATDLSALAFEVGFASHSHFTAAFRKEFGTTPSALRRLPSPLVRLATRRD